MPAYNRANVIQEAIQSVLDQRYQSWELIIVDDGSTDDTQGIVKPFLEDNRITYILQENSGAAHARNTGVANASSEYITFLDSDDLAHPEWLYTLAANINPEHQVVCCAIKHVTPNSEEIKVPIDKGPAFHNFVMKFTNGGSYILPKVIFEKVGGFDPDLRAGQHTELGIRVADYCFKNELTIKSINDPLVTVRHTRNDHIRTNDDSVYEGAKYFINKHIDNLLRDKELYYNYLSVMVVRGTRKPFTEVINAYTKLWKLRPLHWQTYLRLFKDVMFRRIL